MGSLDNDQINVVLHTVSCSIIKWLVCSGSVRHSGGPFSEEGQELEEITKAVLSRISFECFTNSRREMNEFPDDRCSELFNGSICIRPVRMLRDRRLRTMHCYCDGEYLNSGY